MKRVSRIIEDRQLVEAVGGRWGRSQQAELMKVGGRKWWTRAVGKSCQQGFISPQKPSIAYFNKSSLSKPRFLFLFESNASLRCSERSVAMAIGELQGGEGWSNMYIARAKQGPKILRDLTLVCRT